MSIRGIFLSPSAGEPMQSIEEGNLIAGRGLEGDRYCKKNGTYSVLRISKLKPGEREPGRQLTLISYDSVKEAFEKNQLKPVQTFGNLRRNILVEGLSSEDLMGAVGHVVKLGETCRILVHRHCVPCMYNEYKNGVPGMMHAIWNEAGISTEVLIGGTIRIGDTVKILKNETMIVDDGNQPPGYYIPPKMRTADMVKDARDFMRNHKKEIMIIDAEGVNRADRSYETVGLKFWPSN